MLIGISVKKVRMFLRMLDEIFLTEMYVFEQYEHILNFDRENLARNQS